MAETKAYALLSDLGPKNAKVIDLSYGGVAMLIERPEDIPEQFNAVLHVPILPPVRVVLKKAYTLARSRARPRESAAPSFRSSAFYLSSDISTRWKK